MFLFLFVFFLKKKRKPMHGNCIVLGKQVVVSDPCHEHALTLRNVLPGEFQVSVPSARVAGWGDRNTGLVVVHNRHRGRPLVWEKHRKEVGVDSGQAGIFDKPSYRNDASVAGLPWARKRPPWRFDPELPGELWYVKLSDMTLNRKEHWGLYETGVVSSSGLGDGVYPILVARNPQRKIVGIALDFQVGRRKDLLVSTPDRPRPGGPPPGT
jgi:hypothetical protein